MIVVCRIRYTCRRVPVNSVWCYITPILRLLIANLSKEVFERRGGTFHYTGQYHQQQKYLKGLINGNTDIPAFHWGLNTDIPVSHWELNAIHNSSSLKFETDIPAPLWGLNTDIPVSHWVEHRRPIFSLSWTQTAQFLIKSWKVKAASPENRLLTGLLSTIKKRS